MSNEENKNIYVTTAIDYVNAQPHIGHALEKLQADVLARYWRGQGRKVFFLTGTDEHGSKIVQTAKERGMSSQELADVNTQKFKELLKVYNISNDDFIRTSDQERHWPAVIKMWQQLAAKGDIEKGSYQGLYCIGCEDFLTAKSLVDGKCPNHDKEPEVISEENYFFKLGNYKQQVIDKIESGEMLIVPDARRNEILNILKDGYDKVSFSRPREKLNWGVPVPDDDSQVMYVWPDALTNYISAIGYAQNAELFQRFWNQAYVVHVIGKDILRFHAAIWPAMLLAAGLKLPDKIFTHGFITSEGKKMSKSLGNVVDPLELVKTYGTDAVRYYLLREIPATADGDFSYSRFKEIYTADLANGLGNLVSRTTNMIDNYLGGQVDINGSNFNWQRIDEYTAEQKYDRALQEIWVIIDEVNKMIDNVKPWALAKSGKQEDIEEISLLLNEIAAAIKDIAFRLKPYLPATADKILKIITADKIIKAEPLFPRLN